LNTRLSDDASELELTAKMILDATSLLVAARELTRPSTALRRQLVDDLEAADLQLQILRMTIAMNRPDGEALSAAQQLVKRAAAAATRVGRGRADPQMRSAVSLLSALARQISSRLSTHCEGFGSRTAE